MHPPPRATLPQGDKGRRDGSPPQPLKSIRARRTLHGLQKHLSAEEIMEPIATVCSKLIIDVLDFLRNIYPAGVAEH